MGYNSNFFYQVKETPVVDIEELRKVQLFFSNPDNGDVYGFYDVKFDVKKTEEDNYILTGIQPEENFAKFYDSELFAEKLSKALKKGRINLIFIGEDGDIWGFAVLPGQIKELYICYLTKEEYERLCSLTSQS